MQMSSGTTVDLAGHHPIYREVDGQLSLTLHDPTKHYRLRVNLEKGETFYVEFSDEEEVAANRQKAEWEASAPAREAEAKHQAEIAEQFESALYYQNRIVAFLDILGWKAAILSTGQQHMDVVKVLGKTLAALQGVTSHFNSLSALLPEKKKWPGNPVMTQFSDSVVISVDDDRCGRDSLQDALSVLTSNLIQFGFLLRGGITRGELFHDGSLVFGPALIEATNWRVNVLPVLVLFFPKTYLQNGEEWRQPALCLGCKALTVTHFLISCHHPWEVSFSAISSYGKADYCQSAI